MEKKVEKKEPLFGLEEINQVETNEVNGGSLEIVKFPRDVMTCYWNIPPMLPEKDVFRNPW